MKCEARMTVKLTNLEIDKPNFIGQGIDQVIITIKILDGIYMARVFSANCPHMGGPLERGALLNGYLSCPWHGCRFDISNGEGPRQITLKGLEHIIENGFIHVF